MSPRNSKTKLIAAAALFSLSGCATLQGLKAGAATDFASAMAKIHGVFHRDEKIAAGTCPPMPVYTPGELRAIAGYLRSHPDDDPVAKVIVNARKIGDACRLQPKE